MFLRFLRRLFRQPKSVAFSCFRLPENKEELKLKVTPACFTICSHFVICQGKDYSALAEALAKRILLDPVKGSFWLKAEDILIDWDQTPNATDNSQILTITATTYREGVLI